MITDTDTEISYTNEYIRKKKEVETTKLAYENAVKNFTDFRSTLANRLLSDLDRRINLMNEEIDECKCATSAEEDVTSGYCTPIQKKLKF